ncbi:regulatory protein RecX [Bittarella massiliensis (ex Durand et al. 2017)]|uniref:Regulatory protein RecX n=1 Tax=Bittarella massiliensis (ex Durand et al. 2017) TaxID=1720313 RepID=A0AAW5KGN3_9FIRM|nr:regulatory protein RecX [Bittarella massiliensis (ex Durand et al. 2017)]MCQ4949869.1 recombination regulator RecX [Bittarella massiliensis (ex Durand et al. 2017)]
MPECGEITGLEKTKRGRYSVFVDGEFLWSLDGETLLKSRVRPGAVLEYAYLEEVKAQSDAVGCREKALTLLGQRAYARGELVERLCRDWPRPTARQVVTQLEEAGLVSDGDYAFRLADELYRYKHLSRRFIELELQKRGIAPALCREVLDAGGFDDGASIRALLEQKYAARLGDRAQRQKVLAALARRGFGYGDCRAAMEEYDTDYETGDPYVD